MKAFVLCPGPSLRHYRPSMHAGVLQTRIGVNRVPTRTPCHWWVFIDGEIYLEHADSLVSEVQIFTSKGAARKITDAGRHDEFWRREPLLVEDENLPLPYTELGWAVFSSTAAMMLAAHLGASEIECHGVDMEGSLDWDGHTCDRNNRTPDRWEREAVQWQKVTSWITGSRGIEVVRCHQELCSIGSAG